jgi:adenosylcobinamide-GDP ribazoletransferase
LKIVKNIVSALSFFTIIPMRKAEFNGEAIYFLWLPYFLSGTIASLFLYFLNPYLPFPLLAILALLIIGVIHGAQNIDALLDMGDGLMKRGSPQERLKVMKDVSTGAGAVFIFFSVYGISIVALITAGKNNAYEYIFYSQIVDVLFMGMILFKSLPLGNGFVSFFSPHTSNLYFFSYNILFPAFILFFLFPSLFILTIVLLFISFLMRLYVLKVFGGVNGDLVGGSGEIGRAVALVLLVSSLAKIVL